MAFELKPGQGSLFKNDRRQKDTHPHYNGSINIDGVEYWLSGWVKKNDDGSFKLLSLALGDAKQKQGGGGGAPSGGGDLEDQIPFAPLRELP